MVSNKKKKSRLGKEKLYLKELLQREGYCNVENA